MFVNIALHVYKDEFACDKYNASRLLTEIPTKGLVKHSISKLLQKFRETGTVNRRSGSLQNIMPGFHVQAGLLAKLDN